MWNLFLCMHPYIDLFFHMDNRCSITIYSTVPPFHAICNVTSDVHKNSIHSLSSWSKSLSLHILRWVTTALMLFSISAPPDLLSSSSGVSSLFSALYRYFLFTLDSFILFGEKKCMSHLLFPFLLEVHFSYLFFTFTVVSTLLSTIFKSLICILNKL